MMDRFNIILHRNSKNLHLRLEGGFDSSSAHELVHILRENCANASRIFIHTNALTYVDPSGRAVFEEYFSMPCKQRGQIIFTGEKAGEIASSTSPH
jgi:anti-anti-sigma regulatory factor